MNQKGSAKVALAIVLVVVLAGAVAYFGYFKKLGWQTYRNDTYGFEFKYPNKKLSAAEGYVSSIDPKNLIYVVNIYTIPHGQDRDGIVGVLNSPLNQTLLQSLNLSNSPKQTVSYNGISWTKISRNFSGSVYSDYLVEKNGQTFWLGYSSNIKWVDFETILNTFKFVEPVKQIDTSSWQIYKGQKFQLLIPPQWHGDPDRPGILQPAYNSPYYLIFDVADLLQNQGGDAQIMALFSTGKLLEAEQAIVKSMCGETDACGEIVESKPTSVSGGIGIEFIVRYKGSNEINRTILKNNVLYRFWTSENEYPKLDPSPMELFRKIMNTFKVS